MNLTNLTLTLLDAPAGGQQSTEGGGTQMLIMMALVFVVVYFFMIRPQQQRQKKDREYRKNLQKGDKIATAGGIIGKIVEVNHEHQFAVVDVDEGTKLKLELSAIKGPAPDAQASNSSKK